MRGDPNARQAVLIDPADKAHFRMLAFEFGVDRFEWWIKGFGPDTFKVRDKCHCPVAEYISFRPGLCSNICFDPDFWAIGSNGKAQQHWMYKISKAVDAEPGPDVTKERVLELLNAIK